MSRNRVLGAIVCLALCAGVARAQNVGAISGRVSDTSGAVMPGALIELKNLDTGATRTVNTDAQGNYRAPELPLGTYQVEASFAGFQRMMRSGIQLTLGRDATVNFQLAVGEVQEIVTVTGDAPMVETTKSDMGALVSREQIAELPLRNRDFSQLITLQAGTVQYRHANPSATAGNGARISVSGARPTQNSFTLDGADINNAYQMIPAGVDGSMLGVEAIREFKVLSSNYSAQYGRAAGANLQAVSRSGTNDFYGSLFEYLRNDNLDAAEWDDNAKGTGKLELRRNQFGGAFGGPIRRDRLFFFATYEGVRDRLPRTRSASVPTTDARNGIVERLNTTTGACAVTNVTVRDEIKPYLALWPKANTSEEGCKLIADYNWSDVRPTNNNYWSARVDYQFHANHSLFGRYTFDDSNRSEINVIPMFGNEDLARNQYVTLEERSIFSPTFINSVRLGFSRSGQITNVLDLAPPAANLSFIQGRPFGGVSVGDSISALDGYNGSNPRYYILNIYQVYDDVNWERSAHSLKLGTNIERFVFNRKGVSRLGGAWTFSNWNNFLGNTPSRLRVQGPEQYACPDYGTCHADPYRTVLQTMFASYFQDDWRARPNLTINLGVRWEFTTVPTEKWGRLANLRDLYDPKITTGDPLYPNPSVNNISPRIGFAWDPTGGGKTSLRGGWGLFFEPLLARQWLVPIDRQPPFWSDVDVRAAQLGSGPNSVFPTLTPVLPTLALGPQAIHAIDNAYLSPYVLQSSLAIQRMITPNTVVDIGYTWSRGTHLGSRGDMAIPKPTLLSDGRWYFCTSGPPCPVAANGTVGLATDPLVNPKFSRLEFYSSGAYSNYHGLRLTFTRQMSRGLHIQVAYTFSKAMDTQSAQISGEQGDSSVQNAFDMPGNYSLADFYVKNNFVTNFNYDLPFGRGQSGAMGRILRGWQISGVFQAQSGTPLSVSGNTQSTHTLVQGGARPNLAPGGDNNPVFDDPKSHPNPNGTAGFLWFDPTQFVPQQPGFYGNVGRNTVIGPGAVSMDFSIRKDTAWGEGRNVQFRAEFFNLFNTPQFSQPSSGIFGGNNVRSPNAGVIDNVLENTGRQVQLALRITF